MGRRWRTVGSLAGFVLGLAGWMTLAVACGEDDGVGGRDGPSAATVYFETLLAAERADQVWGTLAFYDDDIVLEERTSCVSGPIVEDLVAFEDLLDSEIHSLGAELTAVHVGVDDALVFEAGGAVRTAAWRLLCDGRITAETRFEHLGSLRARQPVPSEMIDRYEGLAERWRAAWSGSDPGVIDDLYDPDVVLRVPALGIEARGLDDVRALAASEEIVAGDGAADDIYLDPPRATRDPDRAVVVVHPVEAAGCVADTAVRWVLGAEGIVEATWYPEVEALVACDTSPVDDPWWTGIELPRPHHLEVTATTVTAGGQRIDVANAGDDVAAFAAGTVERFGRAGLDEPEVRLVVFPPTPGCAGRFGLTHLVDDGADVQVCFDPDLICPDGVCAGFTADRAHEALLHELAHVWTHDHLTLDDRAAVLDLTGRARWNDADDPWIERGVEFAAETMAWGLSDEPLPMGRLDDPAPELLTDVFVRLTGVEPLHDR